MRHHDHHHHDHHHQGGDRHGHGGRGRRHARDERHEEGGHEPRRRGRHGPGGRGLGRFFAHGDLRLVILHLVAERPRHGYEIIKAIEDRVAGAYSPSPGVIYPTLTLLDETGLVTVTEGEAGRKLHAITAAGRAELEANRPALDGLLARMDEAGQAGAGRHAPPIVRALENLRLAMSLRLGRAPLDEAQIGAVAAALDRAAVEIERS